MEEAKKCKHPACHCMAEPGKDYCSTYCHDARDTVELTCNCHHADCEAMAA